MKNMRSFLFKALALLLLLALAGAMFVIGRGHTVYFDNKTLEYEAQTYNAFHKVKVTVGGEEVARLNKRERGMATWIGQNFEMTLNITVEKGGEESVEQVALTLPYSMDGIVINLPAYMAGLPEEAYLSEFVLQVVEEDDEEVVIDEFSDMQG